MALPVTWAAPLAGRAGAALPVAPGPWAVLLAGRAGAALPVAPGPWAVLLAGRAGAALPVAPGPWAVPLAGRAGAALPVAPGPWAVPLAGRIRPRQRVRSPPGRRIRVVAPPWPPAVPRARPVLWHEQRPGRGLGRARSDRGPWSGRRRLLRCLDRGPLTPSVQECGGWAAAPGQ